MKIGLSLTAFTQGAGGISITINGLTGGNAVVGDHASITMTASSGTITARKWGSTSGGSEYGTGTSPTDFSAGEGSLLYATATVDGQDYTVSALIVYAAPVASGGIADQSYAQDSAISTLDVSSDFTGSGITYALAPSSASLPAGLSLASNGQITGTPTAEAAQVNIVVRGTNSGGFDDTAFGVTITAPSVTVPVSFGALTLAGAGGVAKPAGATNISNDGGTNLQLTGGFAVPATNGVTSGTVVWDDGTEWTVTAVANTYSAKADKTEIEAAHAAASTSATTTCLVREGSTTAEIDISGKTFTGGFTLKGSGFSTNSATRPSGYTWGTTVGNVILDGAKITLTEIAVYAPFSASLDYLVKQNSATTATNCTISKCHVYSDTLADFFDALIAEGEPGTTTIATIVEGIVFKHGVDTFTIEDNYIHDVGAIFTTKGDNVTVKGNYSENSINGWGGTLPGDNINFLNNEHYGIWGSVDDPGDVHGGMGGGTIYSATPASNMTVKGNVVLIGAARQAYETSKGRGQIDLTGITGFKLNDVNTDVLSYNNIEFSHNIFQLQNGTGFNLENGRNTDIHHNTFIGTRGGTDGMDTTGQPGVTFTASDTFPFTGIRIWDNILGPDQGIGGIALADVLDWDLFRNVSITNAVQDKAGVTEAVTMLDYLTGDATKGLGGDLSTAEAIAACAPQAWTHANTANIGAINSYYTIGIPGKDSSDTTPALSIPTSGSSADATGHAYSATEWDGTYGLSLDSDATSGTAMLDGASTIADGKQFTFIIQGTRNSDSAEMVLMDSAGQNTRISIGALAQNARLQVSFDWASTGGPERAARFAPMAPVTAARGRFCYALSVDLNADRVCVMVNGQAFDIDDYGSGHEIANALAALSTTGVHFLRSQTGGSFADIQLEALIFENQFIDLHSDSGDIIAQDGFLRAESAIDTAFGRNPLIFLQGNAAAFNAGNGNTLGRAQGVTVTNSGTVTDVTGSNVDEGSSTATFTSSGGFRVAELTNGQTLVVSTGFTPTGIEMVGGGGGGGSYAGGGGGAGELIQDNSTPPTLSAQTYTATGGAGGAFGDYSDTTNTPTSGGDMRLIGGTSDDVALTAKGGGYGGLNGTDRNGTYGLAASGGSGGGSGPTNITGRFGTSTASDGVGSAGGNGNFTNLAGGGGGGANGAGSDQSAGVGGAGGAGVASICPGKSDTLAAGGSGGDSNTLTKGADGANPGDGGGGGSSLLTGDNRDGGAGANGIIRVWWPE